MCTVSVNYSLYSCVICIDGNAFYNGRIFNRVKGYIYIEQNIKNKNKIYLLFKKYHI